MYSTLSKYNDSTSMDTSNKKYSCPNYVHPKTQNFYNYYNLPSSQNTNVEQLPFYKVNQEGKTIGPPTVLPTVSSTKESFLPSYSMETNDAKDITVDNQKSISLDETANLDSSDTTTKFIPEASKGSTQLLPVLDCQFNLREICKQSILLEEHLTQPEKRCTDCCIKHFLALKDLAKKPSALTKNKKDHPL